MPPLDIHIKNSKERTGKGYGELHHWIDDDKVKTIDIHDIAKIPENIKDMSLIILIYHLLHDEKRVLGS